MNVEQEKAYKMVRTFFKNEKGYPFEMKVTQCDIFNVIFKRKCPRVHIMTATQYGKSDIVGMATLLRASTFAEKWCLIAGTEKKAKIIMGYVIKHIFENDFTRKKLDLKGVSAERLMEEKSKERITLRHTGGRNAEIFILGASGGKVNPIEAGDAVMGFGSPNIVEDESALIPDPVHSKVMRMLGGHRDNFIVKIGNPFRRNHFLRSFRSDRYKKIVIDWKVGVKEGRFTQDFIEEMRDEAFFSVLYEVIFPVSEMIDTGGWIPLLTEDEVEQAQLRHVESIGIKRLGGDVAEGGDENVAIIRSDNYAYIAHKDTEPDTMKTVGMFNHVMEYEFIEPGNVFIDDIGDAVGVVDRLKEQHEGKINGVKNSESAENPEKFTNKRAQNYWRMRKWIQRGGCLNRDKSWWEEFEVIRYQIMDSNGKIRIIPKRRLLAAGYPSPNIVDALAYTFENYVSPWKGKPKKRVKLETTDPMAM